MAFWFSKNKEKREERGLAELEQGHRDLETLSKISVNKIDAEYVKSVRASIVDVRDLLRSKGNVLPMDVYSRANGILDLTMSFLAEHVVENGLSAEQRSEVAQIVDTKIPDLVKGYVSIPEQVRDDQHLEGLSKALISLQKDLEDLRELALDGSLAAARRYHYITQQVLQSGERNRSIEGLEAPERAQS